MISYADLVTLLLCLFVVLFVVAREHQARESKEHSRRASAAAAECDLRVEASRPVDLAEPDSIEPPAVDTMNAVRDEMADFLSLRDLRDNVETHLQDRGLVVSLIEAGFYDPGNATPRDDALPLIERLGRVLVSTPYQIRVEGHTDDTPIRTPRFPSNWELSTSRATWLVAYFIEHFNLEPERVSAAGYAEHRPIASNATPDGRAANRRVDVVLLRPEVAMSVEPLPPSRTD